MPVSRPDFPVPISNRALLYEQTKQYDLAFADYDKLISLRPGGAYFFAFPGVWTRYRGPLKKDGPNVDQEVFAFMRTEPNELTASINHERMPVLITDPADVETWLSGSTQDAFRPQLRR